MEIKERDAEMFTVIHPDGSMATCLRRCRAVYDDEGVWQEDLEGFRVVDAASEDIDKAIGTRGVMASRLSAVQIENARLLKEIEGLSVQLTKAQEQIEKLTAKGTKK